MNRTNRPSLLLAATRQVLRPLIRLLLSNQVTYTALLPVLKQLYVEVADQDFRLDGKDQTESRISLLTGVHRKEVKRLREEEAEQWQTPQAVSLGGLLVAYWISEPGYHRNGQPLALPRQSQTPGDISFETLVETVGRRDIRPRAVLDEWLQLGVAILNDQDQVELKQGAFIPEQGFDEKLHYWQRNLTDHVATASRNLSGQHPPLLERSLHYSGLSEAAADELHRFCQQEAMALLQRMNERARQLKQDSPGNHRVNAGAWFWQEPSPTASHNKEQA